MRLKDDTVNPEDLHPKLVSALFKADRLHRLETGQEMTITSLRDGKHMPTSLHYKGQAADIRMWLIPDKPHFCAQLSHECGPDFDIVLEADHIHMEYDPK